LQGGGRLPRAPHPFWRTGGQPVSDTLQRDVDGGEPTLRMRPRSDAALARRLQAREESSRLAATRAQLVARSAPCSLTVMLDCQEGKHVAPTYWGAVRLVATSLTLVFSQSVAVVPNRFYRVGNCAQCRSTYASEPGLAWRLREDRCVMPVSLGHTCISYLTSSAYMANPSSLSYDEGRKPMFTALQNNLRISYLTDAPSL
jgi:hypothetical protein